MANNAPDLFQQPLELSKPRHIYTVSEITWDIKLILENTFGQIWVEGEISNFRPHPSGYFFSLKDEKALLNAVMFNRSNKDLKFKLQDGLKVICFGKIEVYPPQGKYQIIVEKIEPKGLGSLQLALEQLKQRLEKEGLFATEHKRPIPYLPENIGVVTSSHGAAIKDILKVLETRFKGVHIVVHPVRVQGEGAKEDIAQAIKDFNYFNQDAPQKERVEVLIVGRGGGSIEDLWAFNEEVVARAIYNSKIPIISAVGHERDWTIADLVADLRAATPSAAAEKVIPKKDDLRQELGDLSKDLEKAILKALISFKESIKALTHRLNLANPLSLIAQYKDRIVDLTKQIQVRMSHLIKLKGAEFAKSAEKLSSLNPLNILSRGYSVTFKMPGLEIIKEAKSVKAGDIIKTRISKGELISEITEVK